MSLGWKSFPAGDFNLITAVVPSSRRNGGSVGHSLGDDSSVPRGPEPAASRRITRFRRPSVSGTTSARDGGGLHIITRGEDALYRASVAAQAPRSRPGLDKCVGCPLCSAACPSDAYRVAPRTLPTPVSAVEVLRGGTYEITRACSLRDWSLLSSTRSRWATLRARRTPQRPHFPKRCCSPTRPKHTRSGARGVPRPCVRAVLFFVSASRSRIALGVVLLQTLLRVLSLGGHLLGLACCSCC